MSCIRLFNSASSFATFLMTTRSIHLTLSAPTDILSLLSYPKKKKKKFFKCSIASMFIWYSLVCCTINHIAIQIEILKERANCTIYSVSILNYCCKFENFINNRDKEYSIIANIIVISIFLFYI